MNDRSFVFKIAVVGDGRVGKTTLIKAYTDSSFKKDYIKTIGAQLSIYNKTINEELIKLQFWDIAGQDTFHFLRPSFFKKSNAAIIVYSLENNSLGEKSFDNIPYWYDETVKYCSDIPIVVFGNKVDLVKEEQIDESKIQKIGKNYNILGHYITSAKTGQGVIEGFDTIIEELYLKNSETIPATD
ncbi:MAG: Rab family GTPase [Promethearchaeota archaeon]|jgi:small GTP-binding protein